MSQKVGKQFVCPLCQGSPYETDDMDEYHNHLKDFHRTDWLRLDTVEHKGFDKGREEGVIDSIKAALAVAGFIKRALWDCV